VDPAEAPPPSSAKAIRPTETRPRKDERAVPVLGTRSRFSEYTVTGPGPVVYEGVIARAMKKLVLVRHGESTWNKENRFTGWTDVALSEKGVEEAIAGGRALRDEGFVFDVAYTSVLKRAIKTLWIVLEQMDQMWIPVHNTWRLNERHYGALQGLNKAETAAKTRHGADQSLRRSYDFLRGLDAGRIRAIRAEIRGTPAWPRPTCH